MGENWLSIAEGSAGAMTSASGALGAAWQPLLSVVLIFSGLCGLIAIVHPVWFRTLADQGGQWIDTSRLVQWLDVRFDVDRYALRYPRAFGVVVILSAVILALSAITR